MTAVKCPHCKRTIASPVMLQAHIRDMHPSQVEQPPREAPPESGARRSNGLVWEDPPPARRGGVLPAILALIPELRANPEQWARLRTWQSPSGANSVMSKLRKDASCADCEFAARSSTGSSALYGRYVKAE
jgi:hypothetical protein